MSLAGIELPVNQSRPISDIRGGVCAQYQTSLKRSKHVASSLNDAGGAVKRGGGTPCQSLAVINDAMMAHGLPQAPNNRFKIAKPVIITDEVIYRVQTLAPSCAHNGGIKAL